MDKQKRMFNMHPCKKMYHGALVAGIAACFLAPPCSMAAESAPAFRKTASEAQVAQALATSKVDGWLGDFASGNGAFPECGGYVLFAEPGSPFSKLGIPPGSVIERQRTKRFMGLPRVIELDPSTLGKDSEKMVWITPGNERREVHVPPGKIGATFNAYRNMPNWYLRHGKRDAKWDRHVMLALERQGHDPALAEASWEMAIRNGYVPDKLSSWSGMMLALDNQDFARAEAFAEFVVPFEAGSVPSGFPFLMEDINRLAFLSGNPRWLLRINESLRNDWQYSRNLPDYLNQAELADQVPKGVPAPSELADKMEGKSFLADSNKAPAHWCMDWVSDIGLHERAATAEIKGKTGFPEYRYAMERNQYSLYFFSPSTPSRDLDVEIKFRATAKSSPEYRAGDYVRCFTFGLADRDGDKGQGGDTQSSNHRVLYTQLAFGSNDLGEAASWFIECHSKKSNMIHAMWVGEERNVTPLLVPTSAPYRHDPGQEHTLRVVRVGPQAEALLNGRRLALVHVPENIKDPGVFFSASGCTITVTSLKAHTLR